MPSASVKVEKQAPPESFLPESTANLTPLRQAITIIEHKIRNIEKRKSKLESYKELQNSGKELNADQKIAVAKYGEVAQTLEFARDLSKQFLGIAIVSEKDAKRLAKKEAAARCASELAKVREVLLVQDALNQMGQDSVRNDFLNGSNGATTLVQSDLDLLDELYPAVTPKHETGDGNAFTAHVQNAAEHLIAVVDGKQKEAFLGSSYSQIKEVIGKVHESGYLDTEIAVVGAVAVDDTDGIVPEEQEPELVVGDAPLDDDEQHSDMPMECPEEQPLGIQTPIDMHPHMAPQQLPQHQRSGGSLSHQQQSPNMSGDHSSSGYHQGGATGTVGAVSVPQSQPIPVLGREMNTPPALLPHHHHHQQQPPPHPQQLPPPQQQQNVLPPMQQQSIIESQQIVQQQQQGPPTQPIYYQQPQPPRNINEVLGTGSFFFLQDSEIDNPVMAGSGDQLSSINSQTFTSQTFSPSQPSQQPPQQMPMQQALPQQQPQQQVVAPPQAIVNNMQTIYNAHPPQQPQQLQHQQQPQQQILHQHQTQHQQHHQQPQQVHQSGHQRSSVSPVHNNATNNAYSNSSNNTSNNGAMNNGGTNNNMSNTDNVMMEKQHRNVTASGGGGAGHRGPSRINSNHHHQQQQPQQSQPFYANNNGYSNRNNRSSGSSGPSRSSRPQHHNQ